MKIHKYLLIGAFSFSCAAFNSCGDYLDVIPDDIATLETAFTNRENAMKFLFTCYSALPSETNVTTSPVFYGGCENWICASGWDKTGDSNLWPLKIASGEQNASNPYLDYWRGTRSGKKLFTGIRNCNILIENIQKPIDMDQYERDRWVAEVKFLKAYYHFYLFRMYGPIPIIDVNLPIDSDPETTMVYREPVDKVVKYISDLLDDAAEILPIMIENELEEMGRATKPMALAVKADLLALAASPLFNGNPYYRNMKDNRGINLFPAEADNSKWETAATAIREAIDCAHEAGHELYYYKETIPISDSTRVTLNIREAVCSKWNKEIIWGSTGSTATLQKLAATRLNTVQAGTVNSILSPTMGVVERFYTKNGVPIEEDKEWDYAGRYETAVAGADHRYYIKQGVTTAKMHFNREARFYASLSFDGGSLYGNGVASDAPKDMRYADMKRGAQSGMLSVELYAVTGYLPKKLVSIKSVPSPTISQFSVEPYSFPVIRLADLYLLYAEALNESKAAPDAEVYFWIDEVRKRSGLKGVVESWTNYSIWPDKVTTQKGMRDIIHRERLIELMGEGDTYWDMLRWKEADRFRNLPVRGWDATGATPEEFYNIVTIFQPQFRAKDYLAPIPQDALYRNPNLVQNTGW